MILKRSKTNIKTGNLVKINIDPVKGKNIEEEDMSQVNQGNIEKVRKNLEEIGKIEIGKKGENIRVKVVQKTQNQNRNQKIEKSIKRENIIVNLDQDQDLKENLIKITEEKIMTGIIDLVIVMIEDIEDHQGIEIEIKAVGIEKMITTEEILQKNVTSVSITSLKSVLVLIVPQSRI